MKAWTEFVIAHGARARASDLAHVLDQPVEVVRQLRDRGVCKPLPRGRKHFAELYTLWHGRAPTEADWPKPRREGAGQYLWQGPELALLASLAGTMSSADIARVLTRRLRKLTHDATARRNKNSVISALQRVGLQVGDVVGGLTAAQAGRDIRSYGSVLHAIDRGDLPIRRVGHLMVIPHRAWRTWKAARPQPPPDYVRLTPVFRQLGISSDSKPSEFQVHIPTARQFHPFGERGGTSRRGVWFIHKSVARQLIADRRAGRPMPWHGKPILGNLEQAWKRQQKRRHPATCTECRRILGGRPFTHFDDFCRRYPPLSLGEKRHLTRRWSPGLTIKELAAQVKYHPMSVALAIRNGALRARKIGNVYFITRTDAARWRARNFPSGDGQHSWISVRRAKTYYEFSAAEIDALVRNGRLKTKRGVHGQVLVARQQCRELREEIGYTMSDAARRCGVPVPTFQRLLRGLDMANRGKGGIPPDVVRNVQRRVSVLPGVPFEQAAKSVGKPVHWIRYQLRLGRIEVVRAKWDHKQLFLTSAALARLRRLAASGERARESLGPEWMLLSEAARHAGVSTGTLRTWAAERALQLRRSSSGLRYHQAAIETRARRYWLEENRYKRARPPTWMTAGAAAPTTLRRAA